MGARPAQGGRGGLGPAGEDRCLPTTAGGRCRRRRTRWLRTRAVCHDMHAKAGPTCPAREARGRAARAVGSGACASADAMAAVARARGPRWRAGADGGESWWGGSCPTPGAAAGAFPHAGKEYATAVEVGRGRPAEHERARTASWVRARRLRRGGPAHVPPKLAADPPQQIDEQHDQADFHGPPPVGGWRALRAVNRLDRPSVGWRHGRGKRRPVASPRNVGSLVLEL